ncbi:hypothetical protein J2R76_004053 [Bradyrhizobium sp. USDA 4532]|uniref:hypothetical protein n=1 Tax=unclassified Bradyrhizobium TaxID=2631580 RepID=UPI00209F8DB7|nr:MULTISPECIES: hypothetical protein [unclassified Bradyrhizobium]MCP1835713.1 hypothetical protein [Bradyrhizobium sp. USDA 4545]MCP1920462.1 hypothetical protein [Bradyrhizobium sp. USDA 4532]
MQDMAARLEKLRKDAAECALIRDLATDPAKRELFKQLAEQYGALADAVEQTMNRFGGGSNTFLATNPIVAHGTGSLKVE